MNEIKVWNGDGIVLAITNALKSYRARQHYAFITELDLIRAIYLELRMDDPAIQAAMEKAVRV